VKESERYSRRERQGPSDHERVRESRREGQGKRE
jgi:hypothetical protein